MDFSIIIPTHNEGKKTVKLLRSMDENTFNEKKFQLKKIYVVASGNINILNNFIENADLPIVLITEKERKGKAHAINLGLKQTDSKYIILMSGDILLGEKTVQKLLENLTGKNTGVVTGRPIPLADNDDFLGYFVNLIWRLHDLISQREPKAGEILAFKNLLNKIPEDTAADEEFIKAILRRNGYSAKYARNAKIYNEGPKNIPKLFEQRRRIFIGHIDLKERMKYSVPTTNSLIIFDSIIEYIKKEGFRPFLIAAIIFELFARFKGFIDYYILNKNPYKWKKVN